MSVCVCDVMGTDLSNAKEIKDIKRLHALNENL